MTVGTTDTLSISSFGFKATASDSSITVQSFENGDVTLSASNKRTQKAAYLAGAESDITTWAKVVFSIPSDLAPGTYTLGVEQVTASDTQNVNPINGITSKQATLTVTGAPAAVGYTVAVSGDATIQTDGEAEVKLNITHSDANETSYAAYSMKVSYNKDVLTYKSFSDADATVTDDGNGNLTIYRYGKDLTLGQNLTLSFTGKAGGTSEVKVTEAKVDEAANANMQNAPAATVTGSAAITVGQTYNVNRDTNVVDGNSKAEAGKDYTFKLANGLDGKYMDVKYTVGGVEKTLTANADGSYTIPKEDVTGDITITAVGHEFTVTVTGTGAADVTAAAKATYDTDYTFTLNKADNYAYTVTVTAGGKTVTSALDADGKTYTINGKDITGNVVITVIKTANAVQINFTGSGSADVVNGTSQTAEPGKDFTFTITKEDGYEYTVTAVDEDANKVTVTPNADGKTYTIDKQYIVAGKTITVTVEKKLIVTKYTIEVNEYVKLDGKAVFLITAKLNEGVMLDEGKVLAYDGNCMFQNTGRYGDAYAYLVISDKDVDAVKIEAAGMITEVTGTAQTFNVNGDVNGIDDTGLVDINDAQLVYNMYNAKYDSFVGGTTMKMFLAADVNGDKTVDTKDAAAVVAKIE